MTDRSYFGQFFPSRPRQLQPIQRRHRRWAYLLIFGVIMAIGLTLQALGHDTLSNCEAAWQNYGKASSAYTHTEYIRRCQTSNDATVKTLQGLR